MKRRSTFLALIVMTIFLSLTLVSSAYSIVAIPSSSTISYKYHSTLPTDFRNACSSASSTWNGASGNITLSRNSTDATGSIVIGDTINVVVYMDYSSLGYPVSSTAATPLVTSNGRIVNFDVLFNSLVTWVNGNDQSYNDRQGIATHELGHVLGLNDYNNGMGPYPWIYASDVATMYGYNKYLESYFGGSRYVQCTYYFRSLTNDDINGKVYIAGQI